MNKLILYIIAVLLIVLIIFGIVAGIKAYQNFKLYQSNQEQFMKKLPDKNLFMTKRDFKEFQKQSNDSLFNKLKDSLNIHFKNITRTINHKYSYTYDTTKTVLIRYENTEDIYFNKVFDNCLSIKGHIDLADSSIYFDNVKINYEANTIYFFKRKKVLGFIPIGRKQFYSVTENNCTGKTETTSIEIKKK